MLSDLESCLLGIPLEEQTTKLLPFIGSYKGASCEAIKKHTLRTNGCLEHLRAIKSHSGVFRSYYGPTLTVCC